MRELGNRRRNLETLVQNNLLTLQANISWPFDEATQVTLGLDITTCFCEVRPVSPTPLTIHADAKVPGCCLKERVFGCFGLLGSSKRSRGGLLG
jgi:hypothetical protein